MTDNSSLRELLLRGVFPVRARAKINLRLVITGRRQEDGFHLLSMINALVDLHDEIVFRFVEDPAVVETATVWCTTSGGERIADNLVTRAFRHFWSEVVKIPPPVGMCAEVHKFIPAGAGLGGGSSDAAETLRLLRALCLSAGVPVDDQKFAACALILGSDVPYFLEGGFQLVEGIGDRLTRIDALKIGEVPIAIVAPPERVPTPHAYQLFREEFPHIDQFVDPMRDRIVSEGFVSADPIAAIQPYLRNDLQKVVEARFPAVKQTIATLSSSYGDRVLMTGSGACVFVLLQSGDRESFDQQVVGRLPEGTQVIFSKIECENLAPPLANL